MKTAILILMLAFIFSANACAQGPTENYDFVHDLTTCLFRLQLAALDTIEDAEDEVVLRNLYNQLPNLLQAKTYMKKWLENENNAIKATAMDMYIDISNIENGARGLIDKLKAPNPEEVSQIADHAKNMTDAWNRIFQSSGLAVWVIAEPADSEDPKGKIPFIISKEGRQELIKYIDKMFSDEFAEYQDLMNRKKGALIEEFKLSAPVWSALHLRELLSKETYEEARVLDYLPGED
ncbi:MAG: hypothetical protein JW869_01100 [Candidatus Omnitrophica bacterium]|nr:hypothetical protein [Candidatus Omnitrophota bacterium]